MTRPLKELYEAACAFDEKRELRASYDNCNKVREQVEKIENYETRMSWWSGHHQAFHAATVAESSRRSAVDLAVGELLNRSQELRMYCLGSDASTRYMIERYDEALAQLRLALEGGE